MIWVISLRGLRRRVRTIVKPIIILLVIALALWLINCFFRGKEPDIDPLLIPDEYLPLSHQLHHRPQVTLAAFSFFHGSEMGCMLWLAGNWDGI